MTAVLDIFRALADPTRLRILTLLRSMELSVGELAQVLGQSQPRVSRHVKILCDAGLAERRKEGSWVFLALGKADRVAPVAAALDAWNAAEPDRWAIADAARLAAVQLCPWRVKRMEVTAPMTVFSKSQSAKTSMGLFPPSSSVTGISFFAAAWLTMRPTSTLPVNVTLRTFGCSTSGAPHSGPNPDRMLKQPGGSTLPSSSQMRSTVSGASSALFTTTVLPATSAGATFSAISSNGTFQGIIAPTTPSGSRTVTESTSGANGTVSPFNSLPRPP